MFAKDGITMHTKGKMIKKRSKSSFIFRLDDFKISYLNIMLYEMHVYGCVWKS